VHSGPGTASNRLYGWAGYVCAALLHYSFKCRPCGCAVKYCCSFAVLVMVTPFGGGQWMPFPRFGDSYSLDEQYNFVRSLGRPAFIRCSHWPACFFDWLVGRASRCGQLKDDWFVVWWSCTLRSLVLWLRSMLLSSALEQALCCTEGWQTIAVWKGPFLDLCIVPPHYILIQLLFLCASICMWVLHTNVVSVLIASCRSCETVFGNVLLMIGHIRKDMTAIDESLYKVVYNQASEHLTLSSSSSSSSSYICHGVGPLVVPFGSHVSRSLFRGLPWFLLPVVLTCFNHDNYS
jgi:hypothetical protein